MGPYIPGGTAMPAAPGNCGDGNPIGDMPAGRPESAKDDTGNGAIADAFGNGAAAALCASALISSCFAFVICEHSRLSSAC